MKTLCELFVENNCDKWEHNYDKVYEPVFSPLREEKINIFEIGIYKGNSLRVWTEYFPNATVYAVDLFKRRPPGFEDTPEMDLDIFQHDRVKYLKADSTTPDLGDKMRKEWGDVKFDIVIDDGKHTPVANAKTFLNVLPFTKSGTSYFIEDLFPLHLEKNSRETLERQWQKWMIGRAKMYTKEKYDNLLSVLSKYNYREWDHRDLSGYPNSYLFEINL